jgi:4-aminobutyrate aminotransferase
MAMAEQKKYAKILTEPPGPNAKKIEASTNELLVRISRFYPLVVEQASGSLVRDVDGNQYIDFASGLAVLNIGSCHPRVVEAAKKQIEKLIHYSYTDWYYPQLVELAGRLAALTPGKFEKQVFFGNSGAEAVENAMKIAINHTRRVKMLAHYGAFHGRTLGALSLTASKAVHRKRFTMAVDTFHIPFPHCYRCPWNLTYPECGYACVDFIKESIIQRLVPYDDIAAYFFEPCLGEGGYVIPPPDFFRRMEFLRDYGVLFVADEVQTGMGRTGRWFAVEHFGVDPDLLCIAKALANGFPISAVIANRRVTEGLEAGQLGSTFGGNPVSAEAALATISVIEEERLVQRADRMGKRVLKRLKTLESTTAIVGEVRGLGFFIGIDIVADKKTKERAPRLAQHIITECFKRGLIVVTAGTNVIRVIPPMNIQEDILDEGLQILEQVIHDTDKLYRAGEIKAR